jgi:flagellar motor protein MotB
VKLRRGGALGNKRKLLKPFPIAALAISAISISLTPSIGKEKESNYHSAWESAFLRVTSASGSNQADLKQIEPSKSQQSKSDQATTKQATTKQATTKQATTKQATTKQATTKQFGSEIGLNPQQALESLKQIPIKGRAPKTGYSRSAFGPQWSDVDRNGCDTRNDILKRDLIKIVFREKTRDCVVESGVLVDPFSNTEINFVRGQKTSMLVQIDHVVSLSNAWQTGIFQSSIKERTAFANDPINLLAVKGSLNSQKGDGDAATWLPPHKPFRCKYVALQISVKAKYGLWVTRAEQEAMVRILSSQECR